MANNKCYCMLTDDVTILAIFAEILSKKEHYKISESTEINSYITQMYLSENVLKTWATTISGQAIGSKYEDAYISLQIAFKHPVFIVLDKTTNTVLFKTFTHTDTIISPNFKGFANFVSELDINMQYKTQYMSEVFLNINLSTFLSFLKTDEITFTFLKNHETCREWLKIKETVQRLDTLAELSVQTEKLLNLSYEDDLGVEPTIKMVRFDSKTNDFMTIDYKKAKIMQNWSEEIWKPFKTVLAKFKK